MAAARPRAIHTRGCAKQRGGSRCTCTPTWQVGVFEAGKRWRRNFASRAEALTFAEDMALAARRGQLAPPTPLTVAEAWDRFLADAESGQVRSRSRKPFSASTLAGYRGSMRERVLPLLGRRKLAELRRAEVQALVDRLVADGLSGATVLNTLCPLQALCRWAIRRDLTLTNPTRELELPAREGRRDRFAQPAEALQLVAALPPGERALWATALYAGLRRGELRALRVQDVDLERGVLTVAGATCAITNERKATKTEAGRRSVPIVANLRGHLAAHLLATGRSGKPDALVFGRSDSDPFEPSTVRSRAWKAWGWKAVRKVDPDTGRARTTWEKTRDDALRPIALHECRHTAASYGIAAGLEDLALTTLLGHTSVKTTKDIYGHLLDGHEAATAAKLDAFLAAAER